ncbi:bifunctional aminoglycoside phosphotransferase/ATP-binding protein [Rhodoferax ferrireducens]|uniref:bifunctional aminoglycoside phosphotransferase/ATP-binding protein n=1 Tax=Rhodoferax ferrireducens TaxID=192843 RepID=UPI000E0D884D|nr:bifunctional aminoglycoside phosphotransferase/ATP-binding protein [Rhodoferax ferrireducens]
MHPPLPALIQALLEPQRYPDPASRVDLVETHISWVLLAGAFAYKIKKPVTLPFLDFSTLTLRRTYCETELRLNRRFAPALYLDVVAISGTPENPQLGGAGAAIEFAVKMRRFDESARLDRICARGALTPEHLGQLAQTIVTFHRDAALAPAESNYGAPAEILTPALDNFEDLRALLPGPPWQSQLDALSIWTRTEFQRLQPLFVARKVAGRVRECHGDLHLGNLALIDGRVTLFDCIEFNEAFRWIDVASEIAFTYVDLLDHHQPGLAGWFLNQWLSDGGDFEAVPLLRFYAAYRAVVRAKVAAIRASQAQDEQREAQGYLALTEGIVSPPRPRLIITHGLSGCGKTRASTRLVLDDPSATTLRLRSDVERKRLFGLAPQGRSDSAVGGGIYQPDANQRTYHHLLELARQQLTAGWSTIVDAAFLRHEERAAFQALAAEVGVEFFILAPQASLAQLRERILERLEKGSDASEATLAVLDQQMASIEPLDVEETRHLLPFPAP